MEDLRKIINDVTERMNNLTPGSEKWNSLVDELEKLHKMYLDEKTEYDNSILKDEENKIKREQLVEQRYDRYAKIGLCSASLLLYGIWFYSGLKFETTGTYVSKTFMDMRNKYKPANLFSHLF